VIKVSAPGKLMLFGEHAVVYDRPCIVTAVDQRISVSVERTQQSFIEINAPDVQLLNFRQNIDNLDSPDIPKATKFLIVGVKNFFQRYDLKTGLKINTSSDFSSKFGFGSSSATTVGIIKALSEVFEKDLSNQEIFDLSYKTVLDIQGIGSGFDLAAAIWGGTVYFVTGGREITPLRVNDLPMVIGYTGIKADTVTLVQKVTDLKAKKLLLVEKIFDEISKLIVEAKVSFEKEDYEKLGKLMDRDQSLLERLGVSSMELNVLIQAARGAGAYGAKLSGAGGGDCMIAFVDPKRRNEVEKTIERKGGMIINARTGAQGVRKEE